MPPDNGKPVRTKRREISPSPIATPDEFFALSGREFQGIISDIRAAKDDGSRPVPSASLMDRSALLTPAKRAALLDHVASLVDENLAGRSEMCIQFAQLIHLALSHLGMNSEAVVGIAIYFSDSGEEIFRWNHAWARVGSEVIDGNTDSMDESITVPDVVQAPPYWGPIKGIPGRRLRGYGPPPDDTDVDNEWWPRLREWLDTEFRNIP
jgi:hypothetical protein